MRFNFIEKFLVVKQNKCYLHNANHNSIPNLIKSQFFRIIFLAKITHYIITTLYTIYFRY